MSNRIIDVVIVSGGLKDYLNQCLGSIQRQLSAVSCVIVIDNSQNECFRKGILEQYPFVKLYFENKNLSYCNALNKGIKMCGGDFVLCLNDDVILDEGYIEEAVKGFSVDDRIGMVSGKIMRIDKETLDSCGLFLTCWRTACERGYNKKDTGRFEKDEYVFGVNGAVAFYRRAMLEEVKINDDYLDEDYNFFYEDLDMAWRAHNFDWKGYYKPKAIAYHVRGATARIEKGINRKYARRYLNDELYFDLLKNRYLTIIKNEAFSNLLLHLPFIVFYDIFILLYTFIFRGKLIKKICLSAPLLASAYKKRKLLKEKYPKGRRN